jgi:hypothetical protein
MYENKMMKLVKTGFKSGVGDKNNTGDEIHDMHV